jgi:WD40 repeat protein
MSVAFAPDGSRLVSGGEDGWLFVWDAAAAEAEQ